MAPKDVAVNEKKIDPGLMALDEQYRRQRQVLQDARDRLEPDRHELAVRANRTEREQEQLDEIMHGIRDIAVQRTALNEAYVHDVAVYIDLPSLLAGLNAITKDMENEVKFAQTLNQRLSAAAKIVGLAQKSVEKLSANKKQ